jgi:uncharacterized protein YktA (UPF0223 family)
MNDQPETPSSQSNGAGWAADEEGTLRPLSLAWMTEELIDRTQAVWSRAYGRDVSEAEAVEILSNVRRFAEVVIRLERERQKHERRHLGQSVVS